MIVKSQFKKWKWKFQRGQVFMLPIEAVPVTDETYTLLSNSGNELVRLVGRELTIFRHYHFDGATCAPDIESGLPWYAQHDAMCQLSDKYAAITPAMADEVLNPRLRPLAPLHLWVYHWAVSGWPRTFYAKFLKKEAA